MKQADNCMKQRNRLRAKQIKDTLDKRGQSKQFLRFKWQIYLSILNILSMFC